MQSGWLKIKPAAQYAGISPRAMRTFLKEGLRYSKLPSGTILIRLADIDKFFESFSVNEDRTDQIAADTLRDFQ